MNPKALFILLVIILILYLAATQKSICDPPYINHGNGCCIDSNGDRICDEDQPGAFVTSSGATTTTLDPCTGLSGYNKTQCVFQQEKKRYYDDCIGQCENQSTVCRSDCDRKETSKEHMSCLDQCLAGYQTCYSDCGADPSISAAGGGQGAKSAP